jgi:preprotein translocase subunit SecB
MSETQETQPFFGLEKVYLRDVSYEAPGAPGVFLENVSPEVGIQMSLGHRPVDQPGYHEVVLTVQVNARREDKSLFLVEVQQAGVFRVQGLEAEALERTLETACAYVLLPFAREAVSDLMGKGGFPPLLLNPVNFDALYDQKRAAAAEPVKGAV